MAQGLDDLGLLENPKHSLKYLEEVEMLGEEIVRDRLEVVALDRRRNQNREALRVLCQNRGKTWFTLGSMLVKVSGDKAKELLKQDQIQLDTEINKLHSQLKVKVNTLRDMEFQSPVPGLVLKPLSRSELSAMGQIMGQHA